MATAGRDAELQAYFDRMNPQAHFRQTVDQISETTPAIEPFAKAAGVKTVDGARGPKFNQSSLVIEAAVAGKGVALAKQAIALADLEAGRLVAPFDLTTPSNFSYYLVHPASKSRNAGVKAFKKWLHEEAAATGANMASRAAAQ